MRERLRESSAEQEAVSTPKSRPVRQATPVSTLGDSLLRRQAVGGNQAVVRLLRSTGSAEPGGDIAGRITSRIGRGESLPVGVRDGVEASIGHSLAGVRIHRDADAATLAGQLGARAFTTGQDVFFGSGAYDPGSTAGRTTLAHELVHTVQQSSGPVAGQQVSPGLYVSDPHDRDEQEAHRLAEQITAQRSVDLPGGITSGGGPTVQRCGDDTSCGCGCAEEDEEERGLIGVQRTPLSDVHVQRDGPTAFPKSDGTNTLGPCEISTEELTNQELLVQLNRARLYLSTHERGEGEFFDYANLLLRLNATRRRRQDDGHAWLAEPGLLAVPPLMYLVSASGPLSIRVDRVPGPTATNGRPEGILVTPDQFRRFLEAKSIPEGAMLDLLASGAVGTGEVQMPVRERQETVWVPVETAPTGYDFLGDLNRASGNEQPWALNPFPSVMDPARTDDPFGRVFGVRAQETTVLDTAGRNLSDLGSTPERYTQSGSERVYLPPESSRTGQTPVAGASGFSPLLRPDFPLSYDTTGIMWGGGHTSDLAISQGALTARGFRAPALTHLRSDIERGQSLRAHGDRGGFEITARLNRGTPGSYADDWFFPYFADAVAVYRADGTRVHAEELLEMMRTRGPEMQGQRYNYSTPPRDSRAYQVAFGDQPPAFCPPGTQSCVNYPIDLHEQALGGKHLVLESPDGAVISLGDPENATAANMRRYVELPDEWFEARGLRRVRVGPAMRMRTGLPPLIGGGIALAGDVIVDASGGDPNYAVDISLGAAGGASGAAIENYLAPRVTEQLGRTGMSAGASRLGGRVAGGAGGAVVIAPLVEGATMLFDDQDYIGIDYAARMGRTGVSAAAGAGGGILTTAGVGAAGGSVVPGLGTAVGFVVGVGVFFFADWLVGDDVEEGIRRSLGEYGCTDGVGRRSQ